MKQNLSCEECFHNEKKSASFGSRFIGKCWRLAHEYAGVCLFVNRIYILGRFSDKKDFKRKILVWVILTLIEHAYKEYKLLEIMFHHGTLNFQTEFSLEKLFSTYEPSKFSVYSLSCTIELCFTIINILGRFVHNTCGLLRYNRKHIAGWISNYHTRPWKKIKRNNKTEDDVVWVEPFMARNVDASWHLAELCFIVRNRKHTRLQSWSCFCSRCILRR